MTASYRKYPLTRIVSVRELVSADYVPGAFRGGHIHAHPEAWELCCCLRGQMSCLHGEELRELREGELLFVAPGTPHDAKLARGENVGLFVSFTCAGDGVRLLSEGVLPVSEGQRQLLDRLVDELRGAFELRGDRLRIARFRPSRTSPPGAEQMISTCLEQLIIGFLRKRAAQDGETALVCGCFSEAERALATRIDEYIGAHLCGDVSVARLCRELHYGRTQLCSVYKRATGRSVHEAVSALRLERARQLLADASLSVAQVAERAGYSSAPYFSRRFRAAMGCSPTAYRGRTASAQQST